MTLLLFKMGNEFGVSVWLLRILAATLNFEDPFGDGFFINLLQ